MKSLLIAGGGKFGKKALDFAQKQNFHTIIIDNNPECLASEYVDESFTILKNLLESFYTASEPKLYLLLKNISIINELFERTEIKFHYIIPVVPIHLTALIIQNILKSNDYEIIPDEKTCAQSVQNLKKDILINHNCKNGVIYLSYAKKGETCPDDCPGPPNYCPNFKREKPITITNYIQSFFNISDNFSLLNNKGHLIISIHSYQLKPGLGGLRGKDLYNIVSKLCTNIKKIQKSILKTIIATSCNCHGVINYFKPLNSSN